MLFHTFWESIVFSSLPAETHFWSASGAVANRVCRGWLPSSAAWKCSRSHFARDTPLLTLKLMSEFCTAKQESRILAPYSWWLMLRLNCLVFIIIIYLCEKITVSLGPSDIFWKFPKPLETLIELLLELKLDNNSEILQEKNVWYCSQRMFIALTHKDLHLLLLAYVLWNEFFYCYKVLYGLQRMFSTSSYTALLLVL